MYEKTIVVPIEKETWKSLKKMAYEQEVSMNYITRLALKEFLNKKIKKIDKVK